MVSRRTQLERIARVREDRPSLGIGDAQMKMQTAAGCAGERLGHATKSHAVFARNGMSRHLEQHVAIGGCECVVKLVVDLVLTTSVLVIDLLQIKAQLGQCLPHVFQKTAIAVNRLDVVRGFVKPVQGVCPLPTPLFILVQQEKLWLNADPQRPPTFRQTCQLTSKQLTRTGFQRFSTRETIAYRVRHARHEGQGPQRGQLHACVVFAALAVARQAGPPDARAGKSSPGRHPFAQILQRHQFALGHAVQIGKLRQDTVNT